MTVWRIAAHELREAWRTRSLVALAVVVSVLAVAAAVVGESRFAADVTQRERYQDLVVAQWRDQPDRHPHRVSHYGFLVFRPRAPLGFFDTGVESFTGSTIFLEAHRQNTANFSDAAQADGTRQFGELTMAMVLQLLAPLLIFAVAAVAVAREREAGTLWLLLCQGVSWRDVLWGKLLGSLTAVILMLGPGVLLAAVWLSRTAAWSSDAVARALLLGAAHVVYLVACAALGIVLSIGHQSTRSALITLIAVWIALWVVLPRALPGLAATMHPLPARSAFDAAVERRVRELGDSHNANDPKFQSLREGYLAKYGVSRIEELPVNYNGVVSYEAEKLTTEAYRQHLGALVRTYERQARVVATAGLISPFVAMRTVSMALSGVDVPHASAFERQAEEFRYSTIQQLNVLHTENVTHARDRYEGGAEGGAPTRQRIDRAHFQAIPSFAFEPPRAIWAIRQSAIGGVLLLAWAIALVGAVWLSARLPVTV